MAKDNEQALQTGSVVAAAGGFITVGAAAHARIQRWFLTRNVSYVRGTMTLGDIKRALVHGRRAAPPRGAHTRYRVSCETASSGQGLTAAKNATVAQLSI